ncbi:MAG: hypothetical protein V3U43_05640 [Pseudomonadales bacterium]
MQYVNGVAGIVFLVVAVLQYDQPNALFWSLSFGFGALLALITFKRELNIWTVRLLAYSSTGAMFLYFAGFFGLGLYTQHDWYQQDGALHCMSLLIAGFAIIPLLAHFSWQMKEASDHRIGRDRPLPGVRI